MSFKTIKDKLASSVYPGLMTALRAAADFFLSASFQDVKKDKIESREDKLSPAEKNSHSRDNANGKTDASDFNEAPEHWLTLLKRNNLTLFSFKKQSYRKRLQIMKNSQKKEVDEKYKKISYGILEEIRNPVNVKRLIFQNASIDNSSQSDTCLTPDKINKENVNRFKFKPLFINDNKDEKDGIKIESKRLSAGSRFQTINVTQRNNLNLAVSENDGKRAAYKKMTDDSVTGVSGEPLQDKGSIQRQVNIKSQANIGITSQTKGPDQKGVTVDGSEKVYKEKTVNIIAPQISPIRMSSNRLKNNNKNKDSSIHNEIIKASAQEKSSHNQDRVNPDLVNTDNKNADIYFSIDESPASYWQELPEDAWNEKPSENEFIVLHRMDTADIRGILWNG